MLPPTSLLFLSTLTAVTAVCGLTIDPRNNDGGGKQTDGDAARKCAAFKVWQPDFVELTKATYYPANAHIDIKQTGGPLSADDLPAFCRECAFLARAETQLGLKRVVSRTQD